MALKSDAYGFLVGAPVEWGRALKVFDEIRDEVRALRGDIANGASTKALVSEADAVSRQAKPISRPPSSKAAPATASSKVAASRPAKPAKQAAVAPTRSAAVRGPNGRFIPATAANVATVAPARSTPMRGPGGRFISVSTENTVGGRPTAPRRPYQIPVIGIDEVASATPRQPPDAPRRPYQIPVVGVEATASPRPRRPSGVPHDPDLIRKQNAAMTHARPAPPDTGKKSKTATPSKHPSLTPEQKAGDREADRAAREEERAAARHAKALATQNRHNERVQAKLDKEVAQENEKDAARPGVATHAYNAIARAPEIDPSITALHEVQAAVAPVGRGLSHLFGHPTGKDAWYKRIWTELRGQRKDQTAFHKAEQRTLQQIDDKTGGGSRSGLLGMAGGLLSKIPGLGLLGRLLGKIPGAGLLGRALGGGARGIGGLAGLALKGGKGLFRRIPLLSALFSAGSAAASIAGFGDDPSATPDENREKRFTGAGSGIGALVGGGIGTLLGGPVGSIVGGMIGDKLGELVGKWLSTLDWTKIGASISDTWNGAVKEFSGIWDAVSKWFKDKFGIVTDFANKANDFVKDQTGVDVKATANKVADAATSTAKKAADIAKKAATAAVDYVGERAAKMAAPIINAGNAAKDWVLGKTSQFFESGNRGAAAISSGKGDHGGASYGTYQLASAGGAKSTLNKFLASSGYAAQFAGLTPGSAEFNAKWKQIAASDPAFGTAQHDFIKSTHFDPQMAELSKAGIDLSKRGAAVQDAVWSTSVQFGGQTSLIKSALAGKDSSKMSDAEIVSAIQNYKIAHNNDLFKSSSAATQASTLNRAGTERDRLLALAQTLPTPSPSPGINVPAVAESAPSTPVSMGKPQPVEVRVSQDTGDVGQTVSDAKIARLVSGGLS